jgi:type IV pilus assembly protein PilE
MLKLVTVISFLVLISHTLLCKSATLSTASTRLLLALLFITCLVSTLQREFEELCSERLFRKPRKRATPIEAPPPKKMPVSARAGGFTLIEVMIAVAIVAILAAIALPAYTAYIFRSRIPAGLDALTAYQTRMEQRYQDVGHYANADASGCALAAPAADNFAITCALGAGADANQHFTATATGSGPVNGVVYTVDEQGTRKTTAHPKGLPATNCWTLRGITCDS